MNLFGRGKKKTASRATGGERGGDQFFEVHCAEGHAINGRRTEGYQALRCPDCGSGVFVLPRSPLPQPPVPASRRKRELPEAEAADESELVSLQDAGWQQAPPGQAADDEIEWVDLPADRAPAEEVDEAAPTAPPPEFDPELAIEEQKARKGWVKPPIKRPDKIPELKPVERAPDGMIFIPEPQGVGSRLKRRLPMLTFLGVAALVVATVAWTIQRQVRRDYPRMAEIGRTEGIEALDAGEFDKAHRLLSQATRAVEALHGEVAGASEIRQAAKEAAIYAQLNPPAETGGLEHILEERARAGDETAWASTFESLYKGRSILLENARISAVPAGEAGGYEIDYLILTQGPTGPRIGRIAVNDLELLKTTRPKANDIITFGAILIAIEPEANGNGWVFRLEPESGVQMTSAGALNAYFGKASRVANVAEREAEE